MGEIIPKWTSKKKKLLHATVTNLFKEGKSLSFIHRRTHLSRTTLYRWLGDAIAEARNCKKSKPSQNSVETDDGTIVFASGGSATICVSMLPQGVVWCAPVASDNTTPKLPPTMEDAKMPDRETKPEAIEKPETAPQAQENANSEKFDPTQYRGKSEDELIDAIRDLRRQLDDKTFEAKAFKTMIDVAEETLKIDIRKKPGARQ